LGIAADRRGATEHLSQRWAWLGAVLYPATTVRSL
jgi:hypothetical protein